MSATDTWRVLRKRMQHDGIFMKLNSMCTALPTNFSHATLTIITLSELDNLITCIYEGGNTLTHDEWLIVLMLNALKGMDYHSLHGNLVLHFTSNCMMPPGKRFMMSLLSQAMSMM